MTLFYDIRSLSGRALTKIIRNPTLLFVNLFTPLLFLLLFSQLLQKLADPAGGHRQLPRISYPRHPCVERCHGRVPLRHVDSQRYQFRVPSKDASDTGPSRGHLARPIVDGHAGTGDPVDHNNRGRDTARSDGRDRDRRALAHFRDRRLFRPGLVRAFVRCRYKDEEGRERIRHRATFALPSSLREQRYLPDGHNASVGPDLLRLQPGELCLQRDEGPGPGRIDLEHFRHRIRCDRVDGHRDLCRHSIPVQEGRQLGRKGDPRAYRSRNVIGQVPHPKAHRNPFFKFEH